MELVQDIPRCLESSGRRQCRARSPRAPSGSAPAATVSVAPEESHRSISQRSESMTDLGPRLARCRASTARHATGAKTQPAVILKVRDVPSWPYASPLRITLTRMCCIDPLSSPLIMFELRWQVSTQQIDIDPATFAAPVRRRRLEYEHQCQTHFACQA